MKNKIMYKWLFVSFLLTSIFCLSTAQSVKSEVKIQFFQVFTPIRVSVGLGQIITWSTLRFHISQVCQSFTAKIWFTGNRSVMFWTGLRS